MVSSNLLRYFKKAIFGGTKRPTQKTTAQRRPSFRPRVELLESRIVPTSMPPGIYSGTISSNEEFDQAGTYTINANLTVDSGVTLDHRQRRRDRR